MFGIALVARALLRANPGRVVVLVAGAVAVALATSSMVLAASTSLAVVRQTVAEGWRGSFDLLVRPADAASLTVAGNTIVPADYLGYRTAGITRDQWLQIRSMPGVDVAAPVAALGWVKNDSPALSLELVDPDPEAVYLLQLSSLVGDGAASTDVVLISGDGSAKIAPTPITTIFPRDAAGHIQGTVTFGSFPSTWGLVVGVDPDSEEALVGLASRTIGQRLPSGTIEVMDPLRQVPALGIQVLTSARAVVPGSAVVSISRVEGLSRSELEARVTGSTFIDSEGVETFIKAILDKHPLTLERRGDAALQELLRPLRHSDVTLSADGALTSREARAGGYGLDNDVILLPGLGNYRVGPGDEVSVASLGSWGQTVEPQLESFRDSGWSRPRAGFGGDDTVFRVVRAVKPDPFTLVPLGTYDPAAIVADLPVLDYAPLGIYGSARRAARDSTGMERALAASLNPAGLDPEPPSGITNLETVEALRGPAFIDAIRVRATGLDGYSASGIRELEDLAHRIVDATGLHVDVVAGASPIDLPVSVEGHGIVVERWTSLGTAARIVSGAEGISAVLLGAVGLVVLAYLGAFGTLLSSQQDGELAILRRVGWRKRDARLINTIEALAVGLLAGILTLVLVLALAAAARLRVGPDVALGVATAVVLLHLAASSVPVARDTKPRPGRLSGPSVGTVGSLALRLALESPGRAAVVTTATAIALSLAGTVAAIELAAGGELRATVFGSFVAVRIASYHLIAAGAALFAAAALALDAALLAVERALPVIGTLRAVGWRAGDVATLVTAQVGFPIVIGGAVGGIVTSAVAAALGAPLAVAALLGSSLLAGTALIVLATSRPAIDVAISTAPGMVLRAEGVSANVRSLGPRQTALALGGIGLLVCLAAGGWSVAEGTARIAPVVVRPSPPPLPPSAAAVADIVNVVSRSTDRRPGSPSFDAALGAVEAELNKLGYATSIMSFPSRQPTFVGADGTVVEPTGLSIAVALAFDPEAWDGAPIDAPMSVVDAREVEPLHCPKGGVFLLRVTGEAQAPLAAAVQRRCEGATIATLGVWVDDGWWNILSSRQLRVRLPVARILIAEAAGDKHEGLPWIVASLDSQGPGATESAAPVAVAVEIARRAAAEHRSLRVGIAGSTDGGAVSMLVRRIADASPGPVVWLGSMGGSAPVELGTSRYTETDEASGRAGLLGIARVDTGFDAWLRKVDALAPRATRPETLTPLGHALSLDPTDQGGGNLFALSIGLDAAWIGERDGDMRSIAGSPIDTADHVDLQGLLRVANSVSDALAEIDR